MTGKEFVKRVRRYARKNRLDFIHDTKSGKGSHIRLTVGRRFTHVPNGEIAAGTLADMFRQLGIKRKEF